MTPMERRIQALESRLAINERERRQYWPIPCAGGGTSQVPPLYYVVGGGALVYPASLGIVKRTDAVVGSEFPVGTGGMSGDTIIVPAYPIPAGLPNGVGVGFHAYTSAYVFLLLDVTTSYPSDIPISRRAYASVSVNMDKVSGGITYRYVCFPIVTAL